MRIDHTGKRQVDTVCSSPSGRTVSERPYDAAADIGFEDGLSEPSRTKIGRDVEDALRELLAHLADGRPTAARSAGDHDV